MEKQMIGPVEPAPIDCIAILLTVLEENSKEWLGDILFPHQKYSKHK
jgi:hypothetical protein